MKSKEKSIWNCYFSI